MKKRLLKLSSLLMAAILLSFTLSISIAAAYPKHNNYISDKALILDDETKDSIAKASNKLYKKRGVRIAVCTVLDTDDESIDRFGSTLFKKWEIGDGVLILLSKNDDNFYAVQSNSLSEYLSATELKNILNTTLEPAFAEKNYSKGVRETVNVLQNHLSNSVPADFGEAKNEEFPTWATVLIIILVVLAVLVGGGFAVIFYLRKKNARRRREEMELRRRRLAEGRGFDQRQIPRRPAQGTNGYPGQGMPIQGANGRPVQNGNMRPMQGTNGRPMQRPPQRPMQNSQNNPMHTQSQPSRDRQQQNAATIQINTSDIRAAKQNKRQ